MNRYIILFLVVIPALSVGSETSYIERQEVRTYLEDIAKTYGFEKKELHRLIGSVKKQKKVIEAMDRPAEAKPWHEYRDIFLTTQRIEKGVAYWRDNNQIIKKVSNRYKIPPEIIVSILGIETFYGEITGQFPILDTLVTLGFDYPRRSRFFRKELTQFLLLCREENLDCINIKGSYGSAMGIGQFIASSYRAYAVDFNGDGRRDLWNNSDVLGSVANYISQHGWTPSAPIVESTDLQSEPLGSILNQGLKPFLKSTNLHQFGITENHFSPREHSFILLGLEEANGDTSVWVGYHNFYVITRYNHSHKYAMAVYELSKALRKNISR